MFTKFKLHMSHTNTFDYNGKKKHKYNFCSHYFKILNILFLFSYTVCICKLLQKKKKKSLLFYSSSSFQHKVLILVEE
jgi:hypothetical protein